MSESFLDRRFLRPCDERLYCLVRVAFCLVALLNLVHLWPYRTALLGPGGIIEAEAARAFLPYFDRSIFELAGGETGLVLIFLLSATAMVLLALGVVPRAAAVWVFIWHVSITHRLGVAATGWDMVLRSFSLLVMVSPLGLCWSLRPRKPCGEALNYGLTLMQLQVWVIYLQANLARLSEDFWTDGSYFYYFLQSHHSRFPYPWWVTAGAQTSRCRWT